MKETVINDVKYIIGKNAEENWNLLDALKKINENYVWFHLDKFSSCYVIMCVTLSEINSQDYLYYGAQLCKENTKYKNMKNLKIVYTTLNKLTKTKTIGEVIISGKRNIISV